MLTKNCIVCGKAFTTDNYRSKYCSDECKKEGRKRTRQKWLDSNPDYMSKWRASHPNYGRNWRATHPNYERDRSRARRGTKEYKKICVICGKPFATTLPNQITCSKNCSLMRKCQKRKEKRL